MICWGAEILENFNLGEARCHGSEGLIFHDCGRIWLVAELCEALEAIRRLYGRPIRVTSWLRCYSHNKAVGGVANSYHLNGRAIDVQPKNLEPVDLDILEARAKRKFLFVERYDYFIHCDIRGERPS